MCLPHAWFLALLFAIWQIPINFDRIENAYLCMRYGKWHFTAYSKCPFGLPRNICSEICMTLVLRIFRGHGSRKCCWAAHVIPEINHWKGCRSGKFPTDVYQTWYLWSFFRVRLRRNRPCSVNSHFPWSRALFRTLFVARKTSGLITLTTFGHFACQATSLWTTKYVRKKTTSSKSIFIEYIPHSLLFISKISILCVCVLQQDF